MTVDELIVALNKFKATVPNGGRVPVCLEQDQALAEEGKPMWHFTVELAWRDKDGWIWLDQKFCPGRYEKVCYLNIDLKEEEEEDY